MSLVTHFLCIRRDRKGITAQGFRTDRDITWGAGGVILPALAGLSRIRIGLGFSSRMAQAPASCIVMEALSGEFVCVFEAVITNHVCCIAFLARGFEAWSRFDVSCSLSLEVLVLLEWRLLTPARRAPAPWSFALAPRSDLRYLVLEYLLSFGMVETFSSSTVAAIEPTHYL